MTTNVPRKTAGVRRRSLLGALAVKAPQRVDKTKRKIFNENHVEVEVEVEVEVAIVIVIVIVIANGKKDEVEVAIVTVREDEARNAEVTNEDAMKVKNVIEKRDGVGARVGEVGTTTEKEEAEVGIETERRDEVLIAKNREEEVVRKRKEAEKGRAADEIHSKLLINITHMPHATAIYFQMYRSWNT